MPSHEDLRRINKANSIINRANLNIGLRPMYINDEPEYQEDDFDIEVTEVEDCESQEEFLPKQTRRKISADEYYEKHSSFHEDFNGVYEENDYQEEELLEQEYYQEPISRSIIHKKYVSESAFDNLNSKPVFEKNYWQENNKRYQGQENFVPFSKTLTYTTFAIIAAFFIIFTFKPVSTAPIKEEKQEITKLQELTKVVDSSEARSLIITSGYFLEEETAINYQEALKEKLGVPLKLVKVQSGYTIQIGPAYANHDDALLVFDELSRYSVLDLSIKIST